jgi:hypothetical protein
MLVVAVLLAETLYMFEPIAGRNEQQAGSISELRIEAVDSHACFDLLSMFAYCLQRSDRVTS